MVSLMGLMFALVLDFIFSEAKRFHPLVGFGNLATFVEHRLNRRQPSKALGILAYVLVVVPIVVLFVFMDVLLAFYFQDNIYVETLFSGLILYLAIGWRSLLQHAQAISKPLKIRDLKSARYAVSMIVSRDTQALDEAGIASAATESILENGADAIFSTIFWFLIAGVPGVVLYRLSNTLDAMWGYKTERFLHFGWAAARIDDVLNFIPARLTALSYALLGNTRLAFQCWNLQGRRWKSPNAGPVMAAGAGALSVSLGGAAPYHGQWQERPALGPPLDKTESGKSMALKPSAQSIEQACQLVNNTLCLWLVVLLASVLIPLFSLGSV